MRDSSGSNELVSKHFEFGPGREISLGNLPFSIDPESASSMMNRVCVCVCVASSWQPFVDVFFCMS